MKIKKMIKAEVEIGELDCTKRYPMAGRAGMETICDICGHSIADEFFIAGFKKGHPNMKFHESCYDASVSPDFTKAKIGDQCMRRDGRTGKITFKTPVGMEVDWSGSVIIYDRNGYYDRRPGHDLDVVSFTPATKERLLSADSLNQWRANLTAFLQETDNDHPDEFFTLLMERDQIETELNEKIAELEIANDEVELKTIAMKGMRESADKLAAERDNLKAELDKKVNDIQMLMAGHQQSSIMEYKEKTEKVDSVTLDNAFEQFVQIGDRDWPECKQIEMDGLKDWVPIFDAEMDVIALVPARIANVIRIILNRFEPDQPHGWKEDGTPDWDAKPLDNENEKEHL